MENEEASTHTNSMQPGSHHESHTRPDSAQTRHTTSVGTSRAPYTRLITTSALALQTPVHALAVASGARCKIKVEDETPNIHDRATPHEDRTICDGLPSTAANKPCEAPPLPPQKGCRVITADMYSITFLKTKRQTPGAAKEGKQHKAVFSGANDPPRMNPWVDAGCVPCLCWV